MPSKDREALIQEACEALDWGHFYKVYPRLPKDHPERMQVDGVADALQRTRDEARRQTLEDLERLGLANLMSELRRRRGEGDSDA